MTFFMGDTNIQDEQNRMAFLFGIIITGNIIDNVATPKSFAIFALFEIAKLLYFEQDSLCASFYLEYSSNGNHPINY